MHNHPEGDDRLAAAISAVGGRMVAVNLHEVDGPRSVDELMTELPDDAGRDEVAVAVERHAGAKLLSMQDPDRSPDALADALRVACAVVEGGDDGLTRAIPKRVCTRGAGSAAGRRHARCRPGGWRSSGPIPRSRCRRAPGMAPRGAVPRTTASPSWRAPGRCASAPPRLPAAKHW